MTDPATTDDDTVGDIFQTSGDHPIIHSPPITAVIPAAPALEVPEPPAVEANYTLARDPDGAYCIRIGGRRRLTAAEAHQLAIDLTAAADNIGELRGKRKFEQ